MRVTIVNTMPPTVDVELDFETDLERIMDGYPVKMETLEANVVVRMGKS